MVRMNKVHLIYILHTKYDEKNVDYRNVRTFQHWIINFSSKMSEIYMKSWNCKNEWGLSSCNVLLHVHTKYFMKIYFKTILTDFFSSTTFDFLNLTKFDNILSFIYFFLSNQQNKNYSEYIWINRYNSPLQSLHVAHALVTMPWFCGKLVERFLTWNW